MTRAVVAAPLMFSAGAGITLTASTGVARAGTYVISNCPSAGNGNSGSWTIFGSPQADKATCSAGAGDWIGPQSGSMGPNTFAGVTISAPAGSGITIPQARVWWSVPNSISGATSFALARTNGGTIGGGSTPLDSTSTPDDFVLPSTTTSLSLEDYCSSDDYSNGCTFGGGENPLLEFHGAQLTLADSIPPTGAVTGGGLAGTGTVSGVQSLAFDATDMESGVRLVQLLVDGHILTSNDYLSQCPYQNFAACPTTIMDSIGWNTASAPNGPHDVALRIVNAAQVAAVVDDHTLTVHNPPHIPNGSPACEAARLSLSVNGKGSHTLIHYGHQVIVRGTLTCDDSAIIGATIVVHGGGLHTSAATNQIGAFSYRVPQGPNRIITFSYRAFADDPKPAATAKAHLSVLPKIRLTISPRRTFNDGTVTWRGRVQGAPYPAGGVTLLVEVKERAHWQPFDEIAASKGFFIYRYTFLRTTQPTSYHFRVALPANGAGGYDYTPGGSNTVTVHVQ